MSPRLLAASVGIVLACGAGCSSKSSSAPAQAGSSDPDVGSARPAPAAPAQQPAAPANPAAPLAPADSHGDYRERMKQFDTDGDGKLSEDERYAMMAARAGEVLGRNDTDHNGSLSKDELGTAIVEAMKKAGGFRAWRGPRGSGVVPTPSPDDGGNE